MFETAELGHSVTKEEFDERVPVLRERLLEAQADLADADFPVIVVLAGVDGAGKGEAANVLSWWMDPRRILTTAYGRPTTEQLERPEFWRFWRLLPPKGHIGVFLRAWYSKPLLQRAYGRIDELELQRQLDRIVSFERTLANDGALFLKFWMHLGRTQQEERLRELEADKDTSWRVNPKDWEHWKMYDQFVAAAERIITHTSSGLAPWHIVEGGDSRYRNLQVGAQLLASLRERLDVAPPDPTTMRKEEASLARASADSVGDILPEISRPTLLSNMDMTKSLLRKEYDTTVLQQQARLNRLHRRARELGHSIVVVFEGLDAAGKGGAIRRIVAALDARSCKVVAIAAPTDEERAHHYLWRFWRHLPGAGRVTIFDRSWYGRVLVERIEGLADHATWQRAYSEINDFERQLIEHGTILVKLWLHVSDEEQASRFKAREEVPYKRWKLTDEDWRNREKRADYEVAVNEMVERTSSGFAPWVLLESDDKRYSRVEALRTVCDRVEAALPSAEPEGVTSD